MGKQQIDLVEAITAAVMRALFPASGPASPLRVIVRAAVAGVVK